MVRGRDPLKLAHVNIRLFWDDVQEIKKRAAKERRPWTTLLRLVLHDAVAKPQPETEKGVLR